jgi:hypothetical protein
VPLNGLPLSRERRESNLRTPQLPDAARCSVLYAITVRAIFAVGQGFFALKQAFRNPS